MTDINLTVPRGNERELVSQGEYGYIPWRYVDAAGKVQWLVRVPLEMLPHLSKAGFAVAEGEELQAAQPPQGPTRGVNAAPALRPVAWSAPL